jgi:hypothetical protein
MNKGREDKLKEIDAWAQLYKTDKMFRLLVAKSNKRSRFKREFLEREFGLDRSVRSRIEMYRSLGVPILADYQGTGYYYGDDKEEIEKWLATYTANPKTVLANAATIRKVSGIEEGYVDV